MYDDNIKQTFFKYGLKGVLKKYALIPGFIATAGSIFAFKSLKVVPAGHIGYQNLFGDVSEKQYTAGFHFINPLATMIKLSLQTKALNSEVTVASKEGLNIDVNIDTIYKLKKENARNVFINIGKDFESVILKPQLNSLLRDTISSYEAKALYTDKTREEIKNKLNHEIKKKTEHNGIQVEDVLINKIILPKNLQQSIEDKLKSEQEMERMSFIIEKEKKEADRKVIEAQGIKKFQTIVSEGISENLLRWKGIEATKDLSHSTNSKIIVIGGADGLPLILNSN